MFGQNRTRKLQVSVGTDFHNFGSVLIETNFQGMGWLKHIMYYVIHQLKHVENISFYKSLNFFKKYGNGDTARK